MILILNIVILWLVVYLLNLFLPIEPKVKQAIYVIAVVLTLLMILSFFRVVQYPLYFNYGHASIINE